MSLDLAHSVESTVLNTDFVLNCPSGQGILLLYSTLTTKSSPGVLPITNGCLRFDGHRILVFAGLSQIYDTLDADSDGLSAEEATNRLSERGPNRLPKARQATVWQIFFRQFNNPLIYILAIAAIVSFAIGEGTDAGFIVAVLLVNALVGGIQEWRSERSSQALQQLIRTRATVIRDGETRDIDGEDVVPGDVVRNGTRRTGTVARSLCCRPEHRGRQRTPQTELEGAESPAVRDGGTARLENPGEVVGDRRPSK
ncbi:MAG: cation-transporting P-type ATPase [archaeon]